jgi:hypothetical protein
MSKPSLTLLVVGVISCSAAAVFTCSGKVWVRSRGWVYRDKEPLAYWWNIALFFVISAIFTLASLNN